MTETLTPFLLAGLALLIIPGPDMAFVMANGIAYGRRGAFFSALGISAGGLVLAAATALLVAATFAISPSVLLALQLVGCLYLLYVATRSSLGSGPRTLVHLHPHLEICFCVG